MAARHVSWLVLLLATWSLTVLMVRGAKTVSFVHRDPPPEVTKDRAVLQSWCRDKCLSHAGSVQKLVTVSGAQAGNLDHKIVGPRKKPFKVNTAYLCYCMIDERPNPVIKSFQRALFGVEDPVFPLFTCDHFNRNLKTTRYIVDGINRSRYATSVMKANVNSIKEICDYLGDPKRLSPLVLFKLMLYMQQLKITMNGVISPCTSDKIMAMLSEPSSTSSNSETSTNDNCGQNQKKAEIDKSDTASQCEDICTLRQKIYNSFGHPLIFKQLSDIISNSEVHRLTWLHRYWYDKMDAFTWPRDMPVYKRCKWFNSDEYRDIVNSVRLEAKSDILDRFLFLFNMRVEQECSRLTDERSQPVYSGMHAFANIDYNKLTDRLSTVPEAYVELHVNQM